MKQRQEFSSKRKLNNAGMTLVELLVTFMLMGIFMVSAMQMIFSVMSIYYQEKSVEQGVQISNLVAQRVAYTLEGAMTDKLKNHTDGSAMVIMENYTVNEAGQHLDAIELTDRTGSEILISVENDGYLNLHYKTIESVSGEVIFEAEDVKMDPAAYLGYRIVNFHVAPAGAEYNGNILKLEITVASDRYGDYTAVEYIECYNFNEAVDYGSIVVK